MSNNQNEEINIGRAVNKINKVLSNGDYKEIFVDYPDFPYHSKLSLYNAEKMIDAYYKDKDKDKEKNMENNKKPPLGITPKNIHDLMRVEEIITAMKRYSNEEIPIPIEWIIELHDLFYSIKNA